VAEARRDNRPLLNATEWRRVAGKIQLEQRETLITRIAILYEVTVTALSFDNSEAGIFQILVLD